MAIARIQARMHAKLKWDPAKAMSQKNAGARKAMWQGANEILRQSNQLVPLDTGILQASGTVHVEGDADPANGPLSGVDRKGRHKTVVRAPLKDEKVDDFGASIYYNTPYAVKVHETSMDFQGGRQKKFLETAVNQNRNRVLDWVRSQIKF